MKILDTAYILQQIADGVNPKEFMPELTESALFGNMDARELLGRIYCGFYNTGIVEKDMRIIDYEKAYALADYYEKPTGVDYYVLSYLYSQGFHVKQSHETALYHLDKLADSGDGWAQLQLYKCYKNPSHVIVFPFGSDLKWTPCLKQDPKKQLLYLESLFRNSTIPLADKGGEMCELAKFYFYGIAGAADRQKAFALLEENIEAGCKQAATELYEIKKHTERIDAAFNTISNIGTSQPEEKNGYFAGYRKIISAWNQSRHGDPDGASTDLFAMARVGCPLAKGSLAATFLGIHNYSLNQTSCIPIDYEKAYLLATDANNQDPTFGNFVLCFLYATGKYVDKDVEKAIFHLERIAERGTLAKLQKKLALLYRDGYVTLRSDALSYLIILPAGKNLEKSFYWRSRAASNKRSTLLDRLNNAYLVSKDLYYGHGVAQNTEESKRILRENSEAMHADSIETLNKILQKEEREKADPMGLFDLGDAK